MKTLKNFFNVVCKFVGAILLLIMIAVSVVLGYIITPFFIAWETSKENSSKIYEFIDNLSISKVEKED